MADDNTRQGHLETAEFIRPTTAHNGCPMMMMIMTISITKHTFEIHYEKIHVCVELSNTFMHKLKVQQSITHTVHLYIITTIIPCKEMLI